MNYDENSGEADKDSRELLFRLGAWVEVLCQVEEVGISSVTLTTKRRLTLPIGREELRKWAPTLRKGACVGILILDDGSIRVRELGVEKGNQD